ncbi:MAG: hypothetical protein GWP59_05740 [Chlamydiales bacterium]|nr:AIM24 family protein [Chlamydiales bacterium]NCF71185.1 hypothetical protein [Chlamydiales bacterium]
MTELTTQTSASTYPNSELAPITTSTSEESKVKEKIEIFQDLAKVAVRSGQRLRAQYDSAVAFSSGVSLNYGATGKSIWNTISNKIFGGENIMALFLQGEGVAHISDPEFSGSIAKYTLDKGEEIYINKGAWLASDEEVKLDSTWESMGSLIMNGSKGFILRASSPVERSRVFISSFGQLTKIILKEGETYIVDNGHLLAYSSTASKGLSLPGSVISSIASGEGLCHKLTGPGTLLVQSRSKEKFIEQVLAEKKFQDKIQEVAARIIKKTK